MSSSHKEMRVPQLHSINEHRELLKSLHRLLERCLLPVIPVTASTTEVKLTHLDNYINIASLLASRLHERQLTPSWVQCVLLPCLNSSRSLCR